jgi:hypothetical protein
MAIVGNLVFYHVVFSCSCGGRSGDYRECSSTNK